MRQFRQTAETVTSLIETCHQLPSELQEYEIHRLDRLIELQEMLLILLETVPFGEQELLKAKCLLSEQRTTSSAMQQMRGISHELHIQLLRRWWELHQDGRSALELQTCPAVRREGDLELERALGRFDAADNVQDCTRTLLELQGCVQGLRSQVWQSTWLDLSKVLASVVTPRQASLASMPPAQAQARVQAGVQQTQVQAHVQAQPLAQARAQAPRPTASRSPQPLSQSRTAITLLEPRLHAGGVLLRANDIARAPLQPRPERPSRAIEQLIQRFERRSHPVHGAPRPPGGRNIR